MAKQRIVDSETGEKIVHHRRADKSHRREMNGIDPIVRIGLMEEYDRISFSLHGQYDILNLNGEVVLEDVESEVRWTIIPDETTEARAVYSILITAFARRDSADQLRRSLSQDNHPARIVEIGEEISIDGRVISNNIKYRVIVGRWPTNREAEKYLETFQSEFAPRIIRQIVRPTTGSIDMRSADGSLTHTLHDGLRIAPKNADSKITLHAVREGTGFHWEREVDRTYPGIIEIRLDHRALLMALTELPLEQYLMGVVPAEMPASYPVEALKAQAIAARSEVLAKIGVKHLNDPFDLCGMVHCQAYTGLSHIHERSSQAVEETRGQVLWMNKRVAEAMYSSCCGGHTENKVNVWNPPEAAHLQGGWDLPLNLDFDYEQDLTTEKGFRAWIDAKPKAWCNTASRENVPNILLRADKYFRWQVSYSHRELEEIIRRKSGVDIGSLINIVPLSRGVSGRLMEIEILGTKRNMKVQRELNIRRVLSSSYLYSAAFTIDVDYSAEGNPVNFHLRGAGWGHGVGMCQVGAGMMAHNGKTYLEILKHYYPGTKVEKVYGN